MNPCRFSRRSHRYYGEVCSDNVVYFTSDVLSCVPGLVHAVSSRVGGVSQPPFDELNLGFKLGDDAESVGENRHRFASAVGLNLERVVTTLQVHHSTVRVVDARDVGTGVYSAPDDDWSCDALVTAEADVFLMGFSADCPLVMLVDSPSGVVGLAHAGWRSAFAGILPGTIDEMKKLGAKPERTLACVSPAIGACCYEVGAELRNDAPEVTDVDCLFEDIGGGKFRLDLKGLCRQMLLDVGLRPENVEVSGMCSRCSGDLLFSYRGSAGRSGRYAAVIGRRDDQG